MDREGKEKGREEREERGKETPVLDWESEK